MLRTRGGLAQFHLSHEAGDCHVDGPFHLSGASPMMSTEAS